MQQHLRKRAVSAVCAAVLVTLGMVLPAAAQWYPNSYYVNPGYNNYGYRGYAPYGAYGGYGYNGYGGYHSSLRNAAVGAGIGAAVGAGIGLLAGHHHHRGYYY